MATSKAKQTATAQPTTGLAQVAQQVANAVTANVTAGTVARRPAVAITNGQVQVQTKQGVQTVAITGAFGQAASLPATNPALRGAVGTVKNGHAMLNIGNGKGPRTGANLTAWQVVTGALPCTAQQAANAIGSGGAAFVAYAVKRGFFTLK